MEFQSFNKLIQSVQNHVVEKPGAVVVSTDDEGKKTIGFRSNRSDEHWFIDLPNLMRWVWGKDVAYPPGRLAEENLDLFKSAEGRQELARRLTTGEAPFTMAA